MLATSRIVRIPDPVDAGMGPQEINVPVRAVRHLLMVRDAGLNASRPQCTANVNVETSSQLECAEFSDLDQLSSGTKKDQSVGATFYCYDCSVRRCRRNRRHGVRGFKSETRI